MRVFSFCLCKGKFYIWKNKEFVQTFLKKVNLVMQLTPAERAQAVVKYLAKKLGVTQYQIGERIGYTNRSALSAVLTGAKTLPQNFGGKLVALDPKINPAFLSGESDEMLRDGPQPFVMESPSRNAEGAAGILLPVEVVQMFTDLSAAVRSQQETIRMLLSQKNQ